jgi:tetratricopeptide (TPR) repeat protein
MPPLLRRIKLVVLLAIFLLANLPVAYCANLREMYESAVDSYNTGQYDQAVEKYQQIIKEVPQFAAAYIGLGLVLKAQGADIEEVLYYYKMAVDKDPSNVQSLEQLGRLYYSIGQMSKARVVFEKALKINPNLMTAKLSLAWISLVGKNSNPSYAIKYFKDVLRSNTNPNAYFGLGIAYFSDNQREKVLDVITQLKSMGQDDYASRLEKSVRENRKVVIDEPSDNSEEDQNKDTFEKTSDVPKGVKVRLRGKLDELKND